MTNQENDPNDPLLDIKIDMNEFGVSIDSLRSSPEKSLEQESILPAESDETDAPPALGPLDEIKIKLDDLADAFESKIKYDGHKNKIIDELHQALQEHRQGLLQKYVQRIFVDVLKVIDDIRKFSAHYNDRLNSDEVTEKFFNFLETTASDLEDLFSWEGISPYVCDGNHLDPARQRVVNKLPTDDPAKDKTIATRIRSGYEWNGKIIRPEIVAVFVYQKNGSTEGENLNGQAS